MFARSFKIVGPKRFEIYLEQVNPGLNEALVKITKASICKADIRYYLGNRDEKVLNLKYPLSLIHEAIGYIIKDSTGCFNSGDRVVLVPNLVEVDCESMGCTSRVCRDGKLGENYCPYALFASSTYDGFSRSLISFPLKNLVKIPDNISDDGAVFSELISVASSAVRRISFTKYDNIAIWGDGIVSYILYNYIKTIYSCNIFVIGKHPDKLKLFPECKYFLNDEIKKIKEMNITAAFECVGGKGSEAAINQIIDCIVPGGDIVLMGVNESNSCLSTRKVLEKGLNIYGVTRSNIFDFKLALLLLNDEAFSKNIQRLILNKLLINDIKEYSEAFEFEANNKKLGKNLLEYNF